MSTDSTSGGALTQWYRNRIGEAATDDEIQGYWIFIVGLIVGLIGILAFFPSEPASTLRAVGIVLAAAGLALLIAGPLIRLPLQRTATFLVYIGILLCAVAVVWFLSVWPAFRIQANPIIAVYAVGILVMGIGGVLVPLVTSPVETERDSLRDQLTDLQEELDETRSEKDRLAKENDTLQNDLDTARAESDNLRAQLDALYQSQARFELFEDSAGQYRWRLRHRNGNIIADSGEGYTRKHNAQKGMQSVRHNALGAESLQIEPEELPEEDEEFEPLPEAESQATFERYEDSAGKHRFRLRHDNGQILADSGEGYASENAVRSAIDHLRDYTAAADYLWFDPTGIETYRDSAGEWRWRLVHRNGQMLADSGEGYTRRRDARRAIDRIRDGIDEMDMEVYEDSAGEYRWRLEAPNGQIMADSGEGYSDRSGAEDAVERFREYMPEADTLDVGEAAFELYEDSAGEHRWRLRHRNGQMLADSGEGYTDRSSARDGIESVKRNAPNADVEATDE